jgi:hypothetical protein
MVMSPRHQYGLIWAIAVLLTAISHLVASTLTKNADQSFQRFTLLVLQPTVSLLANRIDLPTAILQVVFYAQFVIYAFIVSFFVGTHRFGRSLRYVIAFHLMLLLGAAYFVI